MKIFTKEAERKRSFRCAKPAVFILLIFLFLFPVSGSRTTLLASETLVLKASLPKPSLKKAVVEAPDTVVLRWNKVAKASGYQIYRSEEKNGSYTRIKTIRSGNTTEVKLKEQGLGKTYYYKIRAFRKTDDETVFSNFSKLKKAECNLLAYDGETYTQKAQRIFGKKYYKKYSSQSKAEKNMVTFTVKVWDFAADGVTKITKERTITTNKNIAETVKQIFKEIYNGKERFPIKTLGCYSWRGDSSTSEHCTGLAIDINWEENYMIDNGVILSGKYWKPDEDPYSIPLDSEVVTIMEKYGFTRGFWGNRRDYMHFSYFGT
jgi:hypothetical protein